MSLAEIKVAAGFGWANPGGDCPDTRAWELLHYPSYTSSHVLRLCIPTQAQFKGEETPQVFLAAIMPSCGLAYSLRSGAAHLRGRTRSARVLRTCEGVLALLGSATDRGVLAVARVCDRPGCTRCRSGLRPTGWRAL